MTALDLIHQCRQLERRFIRLGLDVHAQAANTYASDLLDNPAFRMPERFVKVQGWVDALEREAVLREERDLRLLLGAGLAAAEALAIASGVAQAERQAGQYSNMGGF